LLCENRLSQGKIEAFIRKLLNCSQKIKKN